MGNPLAPDQEVRQPDIEPVKKKRGGRIKGSKNKPKTQPTEPVTEADAKSLREFIREITTGEDFRNGLKDRLKTGKLTAGESRLVEKILDSPVERKKEGWQELIAVATEPELVLLADLMQRAIMARGTVRAKSVKIKRAVTPAQEQRKLEEQGQMRLDGGASETTETVGELRGTAQQPISSQVLTNQVLSGSESQA